MNDCVGPFLEHAVQALMEDTIGMPTLVVTQENDERLLLCQWCLPAAQAESAQVTSLLSDNAKPSRPQAFAADLMELEVEMSAGGSMGAHS